MQAFSLDRESGVPVKLQFKAHVKYQIASGLLYPGDQLPALRDLAAGLSINLNTVIRAVDELIEEGYLYSHQGKGVFVADDLPGQTPGAALRSLLAGVLGSTRDWGMSPEDAALALLAQAHLARAPQSGGQRLLLVGTSRADLRLVGRELEMALPGVTVVTSLPEEMSRSGGFRVVVTTLFHSLLLPNAVALGDPEPLAGLRQLEAGATVAVAAGDWVQAARIQHSLESAGLTHLRYALATRSVELEQALDGAAFLLAPQSGRKLAQDVLAGRTEIPVIAEPVAVTPEAMATIRQGFGNLAPTPRLQIRSSWV